MSVNLLKESVMFQNTFNLLFNLHKAYVDIGIKDDDAKRLCSVYEISKEEMELVLAQHETENAKNAQEVLKAVPLLAIDKTKEQHIAYLGDSITSYRMSHQKIVSHILKEYETITIKDFAISGYKVSDVYTSFYPGIASFQPTIAVIMIGTNDMRFTNDPLGMNHTSIGEYRRDLEAVVKGLCAIGCKPVLITLPPYDMKKMDVALAGWNILYRQEDYEAYNAVIDDVAKNNNALLVDMRPIYANLNPDDITIEDGLHLNPKGQTILATEVMKKLVTLL